jgi:type I restriction enzyme S subunit
MRNEFQVLPLGVLCDVLDHKRKPITKRDREAGEYPYYGATGVLDHVAGYLFDEPLVLVGEDGAKWGSGDNTAFAVEGRVWVNNHAHVLRPNRDKLLDRWLIYHLNHSDLTAFVSGLTVPKLNQGSLREIPVPVPPLPEQRRIVALLDEAFAGLATAKANAERNLKNARALFESHLQSVFSQRGEGWIETTLGQVCEMYQPKTIGLKDLVPDGQHPVFGANGVIGNYDKFNHEEPQLLVACRGATCGAVNISEPYSWITGNAMVVRPLDESLDLGYLEFAFRGGIDTSEAITGSAQPQITRTNLSPLPICFPFSVEQQQRLAANFRSLAAETQRLTRLYDRKLAALEELKKSLLHQAFNGDL